VAYSEKDMGNAIRKVDQLKPAFRKKKNIRAGAEADIQKLLKGFLFGNRQVRVRGWDRVLAKGTVAQATENCRRGIHYVKRLNKHMSRKSQG
jgi:hypothetical protein